MKNNKATIVPLTARVTLIIPDNVEKQIQHLHKLVGSIEWSGILVYKKVSGDFNTLKELVFRAEGIYPMNIGSHSYTEFDYGSAIVDLYDLFEDNLDEMKTGLIHSHHTMGTFFSGTDLDELTENAKQNNFYLSLVVNFQGPYTAKVAIPSVTVIKKEFKVINETGQDIIWKISSEQEDVLTLDVDIVQEQVYCQEAWFSLQANKIHESYLESKKAKPYSTSNTKPYKDRQWTNPNNGGNDSYSKKLPPAPSYNPKQLKTPWYEDEYAEYTTLAPYIKAALRVCNGILDIKGNGLTAAVRILSSRKGSDELTEHEGIEVYTKIHSVLRQEILLDEAKADSPVFLLSMILECIEDAELAGNVPNAGLLFDLKLAIETYEHEERELSRQV
jgi:hypothetical protein